MALALNKPLVGGRATELLNILETLAARYAGKKSAGFHVVGVGQSGPIVLHAAVMDERGLIKKVSLQHSLVSWSNIVENGLSRDQLSSVVPGVLAHYDLPDLAARAGAAAARDCGRGRQRREEGGGVAGKGNLCGVHPGLWGVGRD